MTFIRKQEKKGLSLPGLIDIIFLLLIFSLVTLSFSEAQVEARKRGEQTSEIRLPETDFQESFPGSRVLQRLLYQVETIDPEDSESPKIVYVLQPSPSDSVTISDARQRAIDDSLFAVFPSNFLEMSDRTFSQTPPCTLIANSLRRYKEIHFLEPSFANAVEIRAVRDTEFRIINFIITQCSAYGDTIPRFVLHTLTGSEESLAAER